MPWGLEYGNSNGYYSDQSESTPVPQWSRKAQLAHRASTPRSSHHPEPCAGSTVVKNMSQQNQQNMQFDQHILRHH